MKKRTKFTILAVCMIILLAIYMVICSIFHFEYPPDSFIVGWFSAWTVELALLYGIKIKDSKKNDDLTFDIEE